MPPKRNRQLLIGFRQWLGIKAGNIAGRMGLVGRKPKTPKISEQYKKKNQ